MIDNYNEIFSNEDMIKLQSILKKNNKTITCAESCTGGLCAYMITQIAGSSSIFRGSVVTYCNDIKEQELNVKKETMVKYGAVSIQTVQQMCEGVLAKFDADFSIAISGIAGPGGGTKEKPVGTVVIGVLAKNSKPIVDKYHFDGNRVEVQIQAAKTAFLKIFENYLKKLDN